MIVKNLKKNSVINHIRNQLQVHHEEGLDQINAENQDQILQVQNHKNVNDQHQLNEEDPMKEKDQDRIEDDQDHIEATIPKLTDEDRNLLLDLI